MRSRLLGAAMGLCAGVLVAALLAPAAGATVVYTQGWWSARSAIWVAHDDGGSPRRLFQSRFPLVVSGRPEISPNGRLVVYGTFEMTAHGRFRLMVVPAAGGRSRPLASSASFVAWSPDSRKIAAIASARSGGERLVTIDVTSGAVHTVAFSSAFAGASFSPGSDRLVYAHGSGVFSNLDTVGVAGGRVTRLTRNNRSGDPVWGPHWIAFTHLDRSTGKPELYLVKPSGAEQHQFTHARPVAITPVAWSANGHRLLANLLTRPDLAMRTLPHAATVSALTGQVRAIGSPSRANGPEGIVGQALSRDGTTILGTMTTGHTFGGIDTVTLPFHGGKPHVLVRHAIDPSWNR